ncbi:hypothetical protein BGX26_010668 [Mortierella sp. AD094]|nr:hypothetical protein BGX26_010668 [Mortierella sp. AD094]
MADISTTNNSNQDSGSIVAPACDKTEIEEIDKQNEIQGASGQEKKVEAPTADALEWRAKMEAMESPNAIRRWYFNKGGPGSRYTQYTFDKPTQPQVVIGSQWSCDIPMTGIELGSYELIVCVSLKGMNMDVVRSITFDCRSSENGMYYMLEQESETKIEKEELLSLPKDDFTRLRFFRQIDHVLERRKQYFTIEIDADSAVKPSPAFELHYVEIQHTQYHHVVFGSGKPDQIVSVGPRNPGPSDHPVEIDVFDISDTGDYAATLYFEDGFAHIDVWDIRAQKVNDNLSTQLHALNVPFAQTKIELKKTQSTVIDISSMGTHVAICSLESDGVPFQLFKTVAAAPADKDLSQPWKLEKSETICDGNYYFTVFFYRRDRSNSNEEDERFFATDGCSFSVYDIQGKWTRLYSTSVQSELDMRTAAVPYISIQGGYFAWIAAVGVVSIWDFETGQLVSHIYTGAENQIGEPCISPDGTMIAIPVKNTIQIRDTLTGIKLGVFKKGLSNDALFEVVFGQEYFITYDSGKSTSKRLGEHNARSIVSVRDLTAVETINLHLDYHIEYPQNSDEPIFSYSHGPNLNIVKLGRILSPILEKLCGVDFDCKRNAIEKLDLYADCFYRVTSKTGTKFIITCRMPFKREEFIAEIEVRVDNESGAGSARTMKIPLGNDMMDFEGFFVPATSQLVLITNGFVQIWNLSATAIRLCELTLIWRFQEYPEDVEETDYCQRDIISAAACEHGKSIKIDLAAAKWCRDYEDDPLEVANQNPDTLTIPITKDDTLKSAKEHRTNQGFLGLIPLYVYGEDDCKESVIHFMKLHIRPTVKNPTSCLMALCSGWKPQNRIDIERMIIKILPRGHITWIPGTSLNKETDPLALILKIARTQPTAIPIARAIMDYCVSRAVRSRNLAFLGPFFGSLREVMELVPEEALECLCRIAFIPVMHRSYIVDNCVVAQPPTFRFKFWEPIDKPLSQMKDPIMQLDIISDAPDPSNDRFTRPVFMASFDALWYYTDLGSPSETKERIEKTTWWKTLYHMIRLKSRLRIHNYVESYDFNIEFFDNPAIAALVAYKWNTIGFTYWLVRFVFQCLFYALVVIAALMQVYAKDYPNQLVGVFIAIIVMAVVFLWLEILQAVRSMHRYTQSGYNSLDIFAFTLPLIASVDQLAVIYRKDPAGNTRLLSYSVLIVFLHMLFELRINKSVCKYVTIIQQAVIEIRVFFFILAGGIFAFAIATLHLFWSCPYEGGDGCKPPTTDFPENFLGALSATYFFMGGRLDPVSDEFDTNDWGFHLMMAIFFFFTVILMLNVLIALINVAFTKGDDGWRLVWVGSRLRYIESAENMSYHIPGFRQTHNWFPKEIYFTATLQQVREYREKYSKDKNEADLAVSEDWLRGAVDMDDFVDDDVDEDVNGNVDGGDKADKFEEESRDKMDDEDSHSEDQIDDLKVANSEESIGKGSKAETKVTNSSRPSSATMEQAKVEKDKEGDEPTSSLDNNGDKILIQNLNQQVGDLKTQVADLQRQLTEQVLAQREQAQSQFEELKNLLLQRAV